jgi:hypothetical protein
MEKTLEDRVNKEVESTLSAAEEAIARQDNAALLAMVKKAEGERQKMARATDAIVGCYADEITRKASARAPESENAIAAMRDVALACVELAKLVVTAKRGE